MSFKREGNDTGLLNTLRKRRIKELLCEDIPEDEAKLLSNGRFTCLVCQYNPIFDTVTMLSMHRKGKKHILNNEMYLNNKKELKHLINTRKHEQYLKDGSTSIKMVEPNCSGILTSKPYDPRVKKCKLKDDLQHEVSSVQMNLSRNKPISSNTKLTDLPGHSHWSDMCWQQMSGPVSHDHRLKNIFTVKTQVDVRYEPYKSKYRCTLTNKAPTIHNSPSQCKANAFISKDITEKKQVSCLVAAGLTKPSDKKNSITSTTDTCLPISNSKNPSSFLSPQTVVSKTSQPLTLSYTTQVKSVAGAQDQSSINKSKQLPGLGWKRDWDGKWIKDETAEFDSDEEPPDIPLLL